MCLRSLKNRSLLGVNEDFEGKRNAKNLCKRAKHKVYFNVLLRVKPNLGNLIHFLVIFNGLLQRLKIFKPLFVTVEALATNGLLRIERNERETAELLAGGYIGEMHLHRGQCHRF